MLDYLLECLLAGIAEVVVWVVSLLAFIADDDDRALVLSGGLVL
jgi:hypothetical protein